MKRRPGKAIVEKWGVDPSDYQKLMAQSLLWVSKKWAKTIFDFAIRSEKRVSKILDVGCGPGQVTILLAQKFKQAGLEPEIIGIDISEKAIALAKEDANKFEVGSMIDFRLKNTTTLPFNESEFDLVMATALFAFLDEEELKSFFTETYRVLKPEGKFYFICPNRCWINWIGAHFVTGRLWKQQVRIAEYAYTPEEIKQLISQTPISNSSTVKASWLFDSIVEVFGTVNKTSSK